ncbi:hypothetical protein HMPREF1210_00496 [Paenisporosarcina sp. HGH0030]|nr:hypothetical protein HMPREF1210_00496 [Paenisporosarcina sp. HGH0030]
MWWLLIVPIFYRIHRRLHVMEEEVARLDQLKKSILIK